MKKIVNNWQNKPLTKYIEWLKDRNASERTVELYTQALKKFDKTLTTNNIRSYLQSSLDKYKTNTCKIYRQAISSFTRFKKLKVDWEKITGILPKMEQNFFDTLDWEEINLMKRVRNERFLTNWERNNLIIDFLIYSGLRVSEIVNIRHSHWTGNSLQVWGKWNKIRPVLLPPFLSKCLQPNSNAYLFTNLDGSQMTVKQIRRIIKLRSAQAGIKKNVTPHTFRRSFATLSNNNGTCLTTIKKQLGHSNINTTANYIHNDFNTLYEDYSKLWKNQPNLTNHEI
ncbi:MAG: Tyrosine recombinase XerD [Mycoplasmataceae bacterium]|nr:MAG: Tyrosine recombinase XerD [Mycoplasmataceae bacterium]